MCDNKVTIEYTSVSMPMNEDFYEQAILKISSIDAGGLYQKNEVFNGYQKHARDLWRLHRRV
jgi:hypothetical protein